jgi:hypothetical protein
MALPRVSMSHAAPAQMTPIPAMMAMRIAVGTDASSRCEPARPRPYSAAASRANRGEGTSLIGKCSTAAIRLTPIEAHHSIS